MMLRDRLSFYANGGYYNRGLERPVEREDITGGSKYNTTYEGYNWGGRRQIQTE